jgi:AraC-like DNA-binding protein
MSNKIYTVWHSNPKENTSIVVLPDGCRDLIMKKVQGQRPQWLISSLFEQSKIVNIDDKTNFIGFRLKPGVSIDELNILKAIKHDYIDTAEVNNIVDDFTQFDPSVEEALSCLASDIVSVKQASLRLGISIRTLQRLLNKRTEKSPGYWLQLARARKAARAVTTLMPLVEAADVFGFSDQSHMNREFKRWFNMSPSQILMSQDVNLQLADFGYG